MVIARHANQEIISNFSFNSFPLGHLVDYLLLFFDVFSFIIKYLEKMSNEENFF